MPKITFVNDDSKNIDVPEGTSILEAAKAIHAKVGYACGGVCACSTCHVHLREGAQLVRAADDQEEDQLSDAWGLDGQSRLSCCVRIRGPALVIELPRFSRNHAREK